MPSQQAAAEFEIGQKVIWTGLAARFERPVTVVAARRSGLRVLGQVPGSGPWIYDIYDGDVIKGTIFSIPGEQLHG